MNRFRRTAAAIAMMAASAAGCSNDTTTTPTTSTPATIQDTFSGTLNQNGSGTFQFTTLQSGQVTAVLSTLTTTDGSASPNVGLTLGTWNGNACASVITKDGANQSSSIVGSVSAAGTLCVRIYDVGNVTAPLDYTINVNHP